MRRFYVIKTRNYSEYRRVKDILDSMCVFYDEDVLTINMRPHVNFQIRCDKRTWKLIKGTLGLEVTTVVSQFKKEES